MSENIGFIDELIRLSTENENVTKWIDTFCSQVHSSTMVEERNRSLAEICNWDNDMAQLVQTELLKEIHKEIHEEKYEEIKSGNLNQPKVQDQFSTIEKKVTDAITNDKLFRSFLEKVKAPNSKKFLRSHLFPKILLEEAANVISFSMVQCKTCYHKFREGDSYYKLKVSPKIEANQESCFFGYNCLQNHWFM
jgi:hypothetical protein